MSVHTDAYSVSRACATSFQAVANVAESLMAGTIRAGIAGGADSSSVLPIGVSKKLARTLVDANKARTLGQRLKLFSRLRLRDLFTGPACGCRVFDLFSKPIDAKGVVGVVGNKLELTGGLVVVEVEVVLVVLVAVPNTRAQKAPVSGFLDADCAGYAESGVPKWRHSIKFLRRARCNKNNRFKCGVIL